MLSAILCLLSEMSAEFVLHGLAPANERYTMSSAIIMACMGALK